MKNLLARIAALGFLVPATTNAVASDYCVSNGSELQAALTAAKSDGDAIATIKLVPGDYAGNFLYATAVANQYTPAIDISGGWQVGCSVQTTERSLIAGDLVLSGVTYANYPVHVQQMITSGQLVTVTFGAVSLQRVEVGGALKVNCCASGLVLDHSRILGGSVSLSTADLFAPAGSTSIVIRDNLFAGTPLNLRWYDQTRSGHGIVIRGNTFASLEGSASPSNFSITINYEPSFEFSRNLLTTPEWLTTLFTIDLDGNGNYVPAPSSAYDNWIGIAPNSIVHIDPASLLSDHGNVVTWFPSPYVSSTPPYNLRLLAGSPMIDYSTPTLADNADSDIDGKPRVIGNSVDVGAYETSADYIFQSGFDQ